MLSSFIVMIYDSHLHLDLLKLEEISEILNSKKVGFIIANSVDIDSAKRILEISKKNPNIVKIALGLYPQDALSREIKEEKNDSFEEIKKLILKNKERVIAIGEIGMDFCSGRRENFLEQETLFRKQLDLARELELPVLVHTRNAEREILEILKEYPSVKRILHCFCGNMELVKRAEEIGCYFSIPTSIVRMNNFRNMAEIISKKRILTETDAPYLSPYKGKRNRSDYIKETLKVLSEIWKMKEEEAEKIIENNFKTIFGI
jgi:TatD DNase family protein